MYAPAIAAFVLFCIDAALNWAGNLTDNKHLADTTKPLLMPLLALSAVLALLAAHCPARTIVLLSAALALHTAGDIFLISDKERDFLIGAGFFLLGHLCYIAIFGRAFALVGAPFFIVMAVIIAAFCTLLFLAVRRQGTALAIGIPVYAAVLLTVAFSGAAGVIGSYSSGSQFVLLGGILFIASDGMIAISSFARKFPGYKFWIMLTYVAAETLLVLGAAKPFLG